MRVAIAGTGYFSQFHYDAWRRLGADLVGCAALDQADARAAADRHGVAGAFTSVADMLDATRPDLFDICTPPESHAALVRAGLFRGIPTICQKPFAGSIEEAGALVQEAERAGVPLFVHENFRFQPWYRAIRGLLDQGRLGAIYQATFRLRPGDGQGPSAYLDRQPYFQTMPRFLIHETGIHMIDVFRYLLGEVDWVLADLRRINPAIAGEDAGLVLLGLQSGVRAVLDGNRLADHRATNRRRTMGEMIIEGADATLVLDGDARLTLRPHGSNDVEDVTFAWDDVGFGGDCVRALQSHVCDVLLEGHEPEILAADYLRNLRIEEAIYLAASEGVRVRPFPDGPEDELVSEWTGSGGAKPLSC